MKITRTSLIGEVINEYPNAVQVLERYGLPCTHCLALDIDSLEVAGRRHEIDLDKLIDELNKLIEARPS